MWPDMARLFLIWQPKFRGRRENICYFILFVLGVSENGFESGGLKGVVMPVKR